MAEPLVWRVRLADGNPSRLVVIGASAALAGFTGLVFFHSVIFAAIGVTIIAGSTSEYWWGVVYRLDESGATARNGPSVSAIKWPEVRQLIPNDAGVTLSPLASEGRLSPFRGVFLRAGEMGSTNLMKHILEFGGETVQRLV